ncbi:MAG: phosphodiester glycosidase family protein [Firmicutes bacterium]|jgi:hypothetical protein|nr:phosphodiester glycosidase family protein [Bacillota bacterium]
MSNPARTYRAFILLVAVFVAIAAPAEAFAASEIDRVYLTNSTEMSLGDGIWLERRTSFTAGGWIQVSCLRVDLANPAIRVSPSLAQGLLTSPEPASAIAAKPGLIAAVNGDFFDTSATNAPLSFLARDGETIRSPKPDPDFSSIGLLGTGRGVFGSWHWEAVLTGPDGVKIPISAMNEVSVPPNSAVLYDARWGNRPVRSGGASTYITVEDGVVVDAGMGTPPLNASAPRIHVVGRGSAAVALQRLRPGDSVSLQDFLFPDMPELLAAFSGKPVLVERGLKSPDLARHTSIQGDRPAPRTAAGLTSDGRTLLLVVADGRQRGARGLTLDELAAVMIDLGAFEALNLDGGGSSTLVFRDPLSGELSLGNRPSGGIERPVPYVIGVERPLLAAPYELTPEPGPPAHLFITAHIRPEGGHASENDPVAVVPDMHRAIAGGPRALLPTEVRMAEGDALVLVATVLDKDMREVAQSVSTLEWGASGPGSPISWLETSPDLMRATFAPRGQGRFVICVSVPGLARQELAIRVVGPPAADRPSRDHMGFRVPTPAQPASDPQPSQASPPQHPPGAANTAASAQSADTATLTRVVLEDFESIDGWRSASSSLAVGAGLALSSRPDPVHAGEHSAALSYDFSQSTGTRAAYLRPDSPIELPTAASALGLWVFGDGGGGHWLRATLSDPTGLRVPLDFPRVNWKGWRYVEAAIPESLARPVRLEQVYLVEIKPELSDSGVLHLDDVTILVNQDPPDDPPRVRPTAQVRPLDPETAALAREALNRATALPPGGFAAAHSHTIPSGLQPSNKAPGPGLHAWLVADATRLAWEGLLTALRPPAPGDPPIHELTVVLKGGAAVSPEGDNEIGGTFRDPLDAQLLMALLSAQSNGATRVNLVQIGMGEGPVQARKPEPEGWVMVDGVKCVWVPGT